ncbi:MAG: alpha/beta fold hydrolase [Planctomycetota bacterium]|nr:alpha/beta fold hydrolase [Planctomycetota bacterium]
MGKIEFEGSLGATLAARLDEPEGGASAYALFAHCFTCSKDIFAASRIARGLAERGMGVLRFDFTGLGHSEGEFENTTFDSNVGDLVAAAGWLRTHRRAPRLMIGHSLGGAAALAAAGEVEECRAVATIGAPADPEHVTHLLGSKAAEIEREGRAEVSIGGRPFTIGRAFIEDLRRRDPAAAIGSLRRALMVFHSPIDSIVGIDNAARIFGWAKHPKSFVSLDNADHLLSRAADAEYVAEVLAAWAGRYVEG